MQDKQLLNAVVMLIDTRYGSVVNAAKAPVVLPTAIGTPTTAAPLQPQTVYDLTGRRITAPAKRGVYIVNGRKIVR